MINYSINNFWEKSLMSHGYVFNWDSGYFLDSIAPSNEIAFGATAYIDKE